jgi:hypothetical protein
MVLEILAALSFLKKNQIICKKGPCKRSESFKNPFYLLRPNIPGLVLFIV